jgi:hypothetical protein
MNARTRLRLVLPVLTGSLVLSACGLKPEVTETLAQSGGGGSVAAGGTGDVFTDETLATDTDGDGVVDELPLDAGGEEGAPAAGLDPAAGTADPAATGGDPAAPGGGGGGGAAATGDGGGGAAATGGGGGGGGAAATGGGGGAAPAGGGGGGGGGGSTVGIKGDTLKLTIHAPLTGASPLPQTSFKNGADKYWANRRAQGKYKVVVDIVDDKYTPNGAVQACRRAAPDSFLIVGGAGTDQIQACARDSVLRQGKVPYLSAGVTTNGLTDIPTYFATTMTYKQQSATIINMAKQEGFFKPGDTWGLVLSGTPNFEDAKTSMQAELEKAGIKAEYFAAPKAGGDAGPIASQLAAKKFPVVYFLGQPIYFADLVRKAATPGVYEPKWVGPGVSMGINAIAALTCGNPAYNGNGFFLSPYPGYDRREQVAPGQGFADDIEMSIWGLNQVLDQAFNLVKGPLTRESFIAALEQGQLQGGVYTPAVFAGKTRFGGTKAYVLQSNCQSRQYVTKGQPIS